MKKYFFLWLSFARLSILRQLEFRAHFVGRTVIELVWLATQVLFFITVFRVTPQLAGWGFPEMLLFVANLYFVDALYMIFMHENMQKFGTLMQTGLFDTYLLRPISSLFLGCFREIMPVAFVNILCAIGIYVWCFFFSDLQVGMLHIAINTLYVLLGAYLLLIFAVLITTIGFWTTQSRALTWLFFELYRLGHRPENVYGAFLRRFLTLIFPAAFFISIPTQLALGKLESWHWYVAPWVMAVALTFLARMAWRRGIAHYEGALS